MSNCGEFNKAERHSQHDPNDSFGSRKAVSPNGHDHRRKTENCYRVSRLRQMVRPTPKPIDKQSSKHNLPAKARKRIERPLPLLRHSKIVSSALILKRTAISPDSAQC